MEAVLKEGVVLELVLFGGEEEMMDRVAACC